MSENYLQILALHLNYGSHCCLKIMLILPLPTAYRQRKETTIVELSDRVTELERTISEMHAMFKAFNNSAASSALPTIEPDLAQHLQSIALRFSTLASSAAFDHGFGRSSEEPQTNGQVYQPRKEDEAYTPIKRSNLQNTGTTHSAVTVSQNIDGQTQAPWGYSFSAAADPVEEKDVDTSTAAVARDRLPTASIAMRSPPNEHLVDFPITVDASKGLLPLSAPQLAPPSTYSFKESTFARRLLRASYERAYRVMTDPGKVEVKYEMCKFTFCFSNSQNVTNWMRKVIATTTKDSLELWVAPRLHIGNAGLRYPRTSLDGADAPPPYWAQQSITGPRPRSAYAETPVPDSMTVEEIIEMIGYQGEWLDPNDVEHYLKSKGVFLSEHSSWVEVDVNKVPLLEPPVAPTEDSLLSSRPSAGQSGPKDAELPNVEGTAAQDSDFVWNGTTTAVLDDIINNSETQGLQMAPAAIAPSYSTAFPNYDHSYPSPNAMKRKVLDVDNFVNSEFYPTSRT